MAKANLQAQSADHTDTLCHALGFHQRGQLAEAEEIYNEVLTSQPDNFDALHLYGLRKRQHDRYAQALAMIAMALKTNARSAAAHSNYGSVLVILNRPEEAIASCAQAIALQPNFTDAMIAQGNTFYAMGRFTEALTSFERSLAIKPDFAEIHNISGNALWCFRHPLEALIHYDAALAIKPDYAEAHNNDHNRSITLARLALLLSTPSVAFVSLQNDVRDGDRRAPDQFPALLQLDEVADFSDTAAVIARLDLVIRSIPRSHTLPAPWASRCRFCSLMWWTGAGCSTARTHPGIRMHGCSGSCRLATGIA